MRHAWINTPTLMIWLYSEDKECESRLHLFQGRKMLTLLNGAGEEETLLC